MDYVSFGKVTEKPMLRGFLSFIFVYITISSYGQATRLYDHRDYGFGELSSNLINSISQDKHGYIWIATEYGLNKFDGVRFVQYLHDVQDNNSISSNSVTILHRDLSGRLWIGCSNGLQYYDEDRDEFKRISFPEGIAPHITDILSLSDGAIWVATSGWGIFSIDPLKLDVSPLDHVNELAGGMYSRKLLEDSKNHIWIAVDRVGVVCLTPDLKRIYRDFSYMNIPKPKGGKYNIIETSSAEIILSEGPDAVLIDQSKTQIYPLTKKNGKQPRITEIQATEDDLILISTEGNGMWRLDRSQQSLMITQAKLPNLDQNYSQAYIRTFFQDREKKLWLGWYQRGLVFIPATSKQFVFWRILDVEETDKKKINAITTDSYKHIWYSVGGGGVFKTDSTGHILKSYPDLMNITQLLPDKENNLWFISQTEGLGKIEATTGRARYLNRFAKEEARTMVWGKNGKLYISIFGRGFVEYDPKNDTHRHFSMDNNTADKGVLENNWINTMLRDKSGAIWLGHYKGLSCYDPEKNAFVNGWANEGLSEQIVLSLLQDRHGNIWAGTYNGLYKIVSETQNLSSYTTNSGLSSNVISGLGEDKDGNIWCSTFNGINYVNPTENRIVTYYTGDGLVDRSYNRSVYFQDIDGKIYYGGKQGITSFYPQKV